MKGVQCYELFVGLALMKSRFFISKANITIAAPNIHYKTCIAIIGLFRKISEDNGMSV